MRRSQAWLRNIRVWRGLPLLLVFFVILVALPQARMLLLTGFLGGVVIGILLILSRHQPGPRRGSPITTLFPRPVPINLASSRA